MQVYEKKDLQEDLFGDENSHYEYNKIIFLFLIWHSCGFLKCADTRNIHVGGHKRCVAASCSAGSSRASILYKCWWIFKINRILRNDKLLLNE